MHPLLTSLSLRGWIVRPSVAAVTLLPVPVARRYPTVPHDVITFLSSIDLCCNRAENSWFLTSQDYARPAGAGFRWNEYENMALEGLTEARDRAAISAFWDLHFPFMLAVHSDYDYLAIRLTPTGAGTVVHGYAPEWQNPSPIAESFSAFIEALSLAAIERDPSYPLRLFL